MAITSVGYGGTIDEVQWANLVPFMGAEYGVVGEGDWRVTADLTGDRRVKVAPGVAYGRGVFDTLDLETTHTFATITSGSRWDVLYIRRSWSGGGGTTTLHSTTATAAGDLPATRQTDPGVLDDQPIALVQLTAGQTVPTAVVDLRTWQANGGAVAVSEKVLQYLTAPGTTVTIDGALWNRVIVAGVAQWSRSTITGLNGVTAGSPLSGTVPSNPTFRVQAGTKAATTDLSGYGRIIFPVPFPNGLLSAQVCNGDASVDRSIGSPLIFSVAGGPPWHTGNRSELPYVVMGSRRSGAGDALNVASLAHRVNWIAIGW